jgi:hypothetical protein
MMVLNTQPSPSSDTSPLRIKYLPQHPIIQHLRFMTFFSCDVRSSTYKEQTKLQFFIFSIAFSRLQTGRQTILDGILSTSNFIMQVILIYQYRFQISKVCHTFKGFISSLYVVILSCVLFPHTHFSQSLFFDRNPYQHPPKLLCFSLYYISFTVSMFLPNKLTSLGYTRI